MKRLRNPSSISGGQKEQDEIKEGDLSSPDRSYFDDIILDPEEKLNLLAGSHLSNNVSEGTHEASDDENDSESMFNSSQASVDNIYVD